MRRCHVVRRAPHREQVGCTTKFDTGPSMMRLGPGCMSSAGGAGVQQASWHGRRFTFLGHRAHPRRFGVRAQLIAPQRRRFDCACSTDKTQSNEVNRAVLGDSQKRSNKKFTRIVVGKQSQQTVAYWESVISRRRARACARAPQARSPT
jgi:hypothetical protein